ncbi:unnamed protein product [Vicia faba]|uniref:Uncharacterized protein n=1 Tax=Vicia faba TaxID=3906 RepID=A0AAV0YUB7_VICFA|nr:unnamed protein product [Vicia faba]
MAATAAAALRFVPPNPNAKKTVHSFSKPNLVSSCSNYMQFSDVASEMELRLHIGGMGIISTKDISVNADDTSLDITVLRSGSPITLIQTNPLFDRIKPSETIWFVLIK